MRMIESSLFHPVALVDDLGAAPLAVQLLGRDLVLWRDARGGVHAATDRCPHRGAALSMGRVHGDTLECAYHGWRFDGSGRSTTACTTLKMAVVAPIPMASVSAATVVNPGMRASWRSA